MILNTYSKLRCRSTGPADVYIDVLQHIMLPFVLDGPHPEGNFLLQQDRSPMHTARRVRRCLDALCIEELPWPSKGADLNPIENVWGIMKKGLSRRRLADSSRIALWQAVQEEWASLVQRGDLPKSFCTFFDIEFSKLMTHIGTVHSNEPAFQVQCRVQGCPKTFKAFQTFRRHPYWAHGYFMKKLQTSYFSMYGLDVPPSQAADTQGEDSPGIDKTEPSRKAASSGHLNKLKRHLVLFYLKETGVPGTIGCIDGSYVAIECPANKIRSTHVNRHHYPSLTLQAICDCNKRFLDRTTGHPRLHPLGAVSSRSCAVFDQISTQGDRFMNIILTDDFNLHINWNSADLRLTNETEAKFLDWINYANLTQVVRFPTHIHGNNLEHTLDLVLCRNPAQLQSVSNTPPLSNSDHVGISSTWHLGSSGKRFVARQALMFNTDGPATLEHSVASVPWFLCMDFLDLFYNMFWAACKDATYTKLISKNKKCKPWITRPIRQLSSKTKRLFRKASRSQDAGLGELLHP
ncbi:hypothetical protein HPB47_019793 [Ixodes persulcatus]|uniref:Uncharacterized protein n=1 Tax=Ixodes persulcatus TaxID=34615 RepID=A0AC60QJE3_IXOPE|nr:hypothetical protein HPB47_019793 [Ixodes persulcatus]